MRSRSQCRIGMARPLFAALLPMALSVPAPAQFSNTGNSYYPVSPGRNAVGSAYGDGGAETASQRRSPQYENHRSGPGYGGHLNWLPGATGLLGVLPMLGSGNASPSSWPSWEQIPARSESPPSVPGYQAYPGSLPQTQPGRPGSGATPYAPNWQTQPRPEPSGEAAITPPDSSASSSTRPPLRTRHPPSGKPPSVNVVGSSHPVIYPPRKPPVPPAQQIEPPSSPQPAAPVAAAVAMIADAPPAAPIAAAPPTEPPAPAITAPATPPSPPPAPPTKAPSAQRPAKPFWSVSQIGLPLSALVALALLVFPLRILTKVWRRRLRQRVARVVLVGDPGASLMTPRQAGTEYPAIILRVTAVAPVATMRWTAA
jgi:hypothetical protein